MVYLPKHLALVGVVPLAVYRRFHRFSSLSLSLFVRNARLPHGFQGSCGPAHLPIRVGAPVRGEIAAEGYTVITCTVTDFRFG